MDGVRIHSFGLSSLRMPPFDPTPYVALKNSLRTSHGREFVRHGWAGAGPIFRGLNVELAKAIDEVPVVLRLLEIGCTIIEITPKFIVFDIFCGDKKFFAKDGPSDDYFEYNNYEEKNSDNNHKNENQ